MITLTSTHEKLKAEFATLQTSFSSLQAEHNNLKEAHAALEKQLAEPVSAAALEALTKDLEASTISNTQLTEANAVLVKELETIKSEKQEFQEMVAAKAIEIASSQGVPPLQIKPSAQPSPTSLDNDVVAQYDSLTGQAQADFWVKNREALSKAYKGR